MSSRRSRSKASTAADSGPSSASTSRAQSRNAAKEARRIRGEIACAECRRLKIKCDRKVPCSTCIARGCAVLCPNDVLPPGDNSRHVDYATDHLQAKISRMEQRMRVLEDALQLAQMQQSDEQHPLLRTPFKMDDDEPETQEATNTPVEDELVDAMGSLHINERDKSVQFYGPGGGAESLLRHEGNKKSSRTFAVQDNTTPMALRALGLPQELDVFFLSFPFTPMGIPRAPIRAMIEALLPPRERVEELSEIMTEHLSWMFRIVSLGYLKTELIPVVYRRPVGDPRRVDDYSPHDLALMLIVCALGALMDFTQKPYNAEAHRYAALARTAAGLQPLMEDISLASVKFIHLLSIYNGMSGKESAISNTYALTNFAGFMAQKIGLHMDPSLWKLDEKTCYERRSYFWELLQADIWLCLSSGRPPCLSNSGAHCKIPTEAEERQFQQGEKAIGFGVWGNKYTRDCLLPLVRHINSTSPPSYQSVLDLENKFASYQLPLADHEKLGPQASVTTSMRAWVRSHYYELILLFLHRAFFAKAIATHPDNPLQSQYAHSFTTAYRCACAFLRTTKYQHGLYPQVMSRVWQVWTFAFTSAVIVGAVASRSQQLDLDPPPLQMFDDTLQLFREASSISPRAAKALPVLLSIHDTATKLHGGKGQQPMYHTAGATLSPGSSQIQDAVAIWAGKTRVVAQSVASPSPFPGTTQLPPQSHPTASTHPTYLQSHSHPLSHISHHTTHAHIPSSHAAAHYQSMSLHSGGQQSYPAYHDATAGAHPGGATDQWSGQGQGLGLSPGELSHQSVYQYHTDESQPVDFILHDAWSSFLQSYGAIPPPR